MELHLWERVILLVVVLLSGGCFIVIVVYLIPLMKQLKKTAQRLEEAASSFDTVLTTDFKAFLNQGERILENWEEEVQPLIKNKLKNIQSAASQIAFAEMGGRLLRIAILWVAKEAWDRIRGKRKKSVVT